MRGRGLEEKCYTNTILYKTPLFIWSINYKKCSHKHELICIVFKDLSIVLFPKLLEMEIKG